jgi:AbrB family looped-hinge helix DNA binding protein
MTGGGRAAAAVTELDDHFRQSYSVGMTVRVGAKGQVVIPKSVRDRIGLHLGDEVDFELREDDVVVLVPRAKSAGLGGRFGGSGMADRLLADRRHEPR